MEGDLNIYKGASEEVNDFFLGMTMPHFTKSVTLIIWFHFEEEDVVKYQWHLKQGKGLLL